MEVGASIILNKLWRNVHLFSDWRRCIRSENLGRKMVQHRPTPKSGTELSVPVVWVPRYLGVRVARYPEERPEVDCPTLESTDCCLWNVIALQHVLNINSITSVLYTSDDRKTKTPIYHHAADWKSINRNLFILLLTEAHAQLPYVIIKSKAPLLIDPTRPAGIPVPVVYPYDSH